MILSYILASFTFHIGQKLFQTTLILTHVIWGIFSADSTKILQYMCMKSSYGAPETYTVLYVNCISIKLENLYLCSNFHFL